MLDWLCFLLGMVEVGRGIIRWHGWLPITVCVPTWCDICCGGCCDEWAASVYIGGGCCDDSGGWCDDCVAWFCVGGGCYDD